MIQLTKLRELTLSAPSSPGRHAHLSAASGLVKAGDFLYVVADDEVHLGVFPSEGDAPGSLIRLFAGTLPTTKAQRKQRKPDFEALARLPAFPGYPAGALLCLPSGSRPNRRTGALLALCANGAVTGEPRSIDLSSLYNVLANPFPALNIEGATVVDDALLLLQRGGQQDPRNACIRYSLPAVLRVLGAADWLSNVAPVDTQFVNLGDIEGVPLGFSDVATLPGVGLIFTAIAEATADSYLDGPCVGAAIGIIDTGGSLRYLERVEHAPKIEGIHAEIAGQLIRIWLVTDADDEDIPASLLTGEICVD